MKSIPLSICGTDFHKESSTSGITYTLTSARNSVLQLPEIEGQALVISVENLSDKVAIFRGQSRRDGVKFQIPLGANAIQQVVVPLTEDYILSTTHNLKISDVSVLQTHLPDAASYDEIETPSPIFQISANPVPAYTKEVGYKVTGLANVYFVNTYGKEDYIILSASGNILVWRIGELRLQTEQDFEFVLPALEVPRTFSVSSAAPYNLKISSYTKRYINPAYVAPEAALWRLENIL